MLCILSAAYTVPALLLAQRGRYYIHQTSLYYEAMCILVVATMSVEMARPAIRPLFPLARAYCFWHLTWWLVYCSLELAPIKKVFGR